MFALSFLFRQSRWIRTNLPLQGRPFDLVASETNLNSRKLYGGVCAPSSNGQPIQGPTSASFPFQLNFTLISYLCFIFCWNCMGFGVP